MSELSKLPLRCPCCSLPTIGERGWYEICTVCWWEDDGQDDSDADDVLGGPNKGYSLSAARENFKKHGHMYDSGRGIAAVERPSRARSKLLEYAQSVLRGSELLDEQRLLELLKAEAGGS